MIVLLAVARWFYKAGRADALTQTDTIILMDFSNKTGDDIFDAVENERTGGLKEHFIPVRAVLANRKDAAAREPA